MAAKQSSEFFGRELYYFLFDGPTVDDSCLIVGRKCEVAYTLLVGNASTRVTPIPFKYFQDPSASQLVKWDLHSALLCSTLPSIRFAPRVGKANRKKLM